MLPWFANVLKTRFPLRTLFIDARRRPFKEWTLFQPKVAFSDEIAVTNVDYFDPDRLGLSSHQSCSTTCAPVHLFVVCSLLQNFGFISWLSFVDVSIDTSFDFQPMLIMELIRWLYLRRKPYYWTCMVFHTLECIRLLSVLHISWIQPYGKRRPAWRLSGVRGTESHLQMASLAIEGRFHIYLDLTLSMCFSCFYVSAGDAGTTYTLHDGFVELRWYSTWALGLCFIVLLWGVTSCMQLGLL